MSLLSRILGTILIFCGFLLAVKFGTDALSALDRQCQAATLFIGACRAIWLSLAALLTFLAFYLAMLLTNKVWGRNLFKGRVR